MEINIEVKEYMESLGYKLGKFSDDGEFLTYYKDKEWVHPDEAKNWFDHKDDYSKKLQELFFGNKYSNNN